MNQIAPSDLQTLLCQINVWTTVMIMNVVDTNPIGLSTAQFSRDWIEQKIEEGVYVYFGRVELSFDDRPDPAPSASEIDDMIRHQLTMAVMDIKRSMDAAAEMRELEPAPDEAPCRLYLTTPEERATPPKSPATNRC